MVNVSHGSVTAEKVLVVGGRFFRRMATGAAVSGPVGVWLCGLGSQGGSDRVEVDQNDGPDGLERRFSGSEVPALAGVVAVNDQSEQPLDPWSCVVEVIAFDGVR
jgi:hypothetical protein